MEKRFEAKSVHLGSGAIMEHDNSDIYKLMNIMVKIKFPRVADLRSQGPSREEIVDQLVQEIKDKLMSINSIDASFGGNPHPKPEKVKNLTPFRGNEEIADDDKFGWYKLV